MERYPKVTQLINKLDTEDYQAYKECVKVVAEISAFDTDVIPFLWNEMLFAVLNSLKIEIKYDTKQTVSNWLNATMMWNAEKHSPLAKEGYYPFPEVGEYYDFAFARELNYLSHVDDSDLRVYINTIALFETLRYYICMYLTRPSKILSFLGGYKVVEPCFTEDHMWKIVIDIWPINIDWSYYDIISDGHDFTYDTHNQTKKLDKILAEKKYLEIMPNGNRYTLPAYEFYLGSITDEYGMVYSADGRILLRCTNKDVECYIIKDGTRIICSDAFHQNSELDDITLPSSVVYIENGGFYGCTNLRKVTFEGEGLEVIGAYAFGDCVSLWKIDLPDTLKIIDQGALYNTGLPFFNVGKNVKKLTGGFEEYTDTSIYSIGGESTSGIYVDEENPYFCSIDGMLFSKDKKVLYQCPSGKINPLFCDNIESILIPQGTEELYACCCEDIVGLKRLILPSTIKKIGDSIISGEVRELALFTDCPPLVGELKNEELIIRVHNESVGLYRNDEKWSKIICKCIIGIDDLAPGAKAGLSALQLWTLGAGNSARRFNGENPIPAKTVVATEKSMEIKPMPKDNVVIPLGITLSDDMMECIKYGHIPDAMEDHWFMYCDEDTIRYYRSWTGICIYVAKYEKTDGGYIITELIANRSPDEYGCKDNNYDFALFMALLTEEYGGDASVFWEAVCKK